MRINSNHNFLAFDREIDSVRDWLGTRVFCVRDYSKETLLDRLVQRLVGIGLQPYTLTVHASCVAGEGKFPSAGTRIDFGRASIEAGTGRVRITPRQMLSNHWDFLIHWAYCLLTILTPKASSSLRNEPAVIVLGVGVESLFADGDDSRFISYCRSGPLKPFRDGKRFLIQTALKSAFSTQHPYYSYYRNPLIALLRESRLGLIGRIQLLWGHFTMFFAYMLATFRLPSLSLLGRDFAYAPISSVLDSRELIRDVVTTCSDYTTQPLWMRNLRHAETHMVWYAQNWKPHVYKRDNLSANIPNLRWIRVGAHWVWTHAFADYLRELGQAGRIEVVGPITWYLPKLVKPPVDHIKLTVFDISPYQNDIAIMYGEISNYNHPNNLFAFINDIIFVRSELEAKFRKKISISLKTKRGYNPAYDRAYFDYIEGLGSDGVIAMELHSINMYSLISGSHLIVAYPFTSPAYVAESLSVPSIYFDPTGAIVRQDVGDSESLIKFAATRAELLSCAVSALHEYT